jgi:hypothetical protein
MTNDDDGYNKNDSIDNSRLLGVPQLIDWWLQPHFLF